MNKMFVTPNGVKKVKLMMDMIERKKDQIKLLEYEIERLEKKIEKETVK